MAALRDDFTFERVWWHAGNPDLSKVGAPNINGGLHLGTLSQALMRRRPDDDLHAFRVHIPSGRKRWGFMRDLDGHWRKRCDAHRYRGKLAMVYLNRIEGCFHHGGGARPSHDWMKAATDTEFRKEFPEASWSIIALCPDILEPIDASEKMQLYRAA